MRTVYILGASGKMANFSASDHTILCKYAFSDKEKANAYTPTFLKLATRPKNDTDITYLDKEKVKVSVTPVHLVE